MGQKNQVRDYRMSSKPKQKSAPKASTAMQAPEATPEVAPEPEMIEPTFGAMTSTQAASSPEKKLDASVDVEVTDTAKVKVEPAADVAQPAQVDLFESESYFDLVDEEEETVVQEPAAPKTQAPKSNTQVNSAPIEVSTIEDVLVIHVKASSRHPYAGDKVLACMETLNLKFGMMNIFHHHKDAGEPVFSATNMAAPGTFDLEAMPTSEYYGISLFLKLPNSDPLTSFSLLLNAASTLVNQLGGQLLNDQREPWRQDSKIKYLERIKLVSQEVAL